jgi:hypothetical protein
LDLNLEVLKKRIWEKMGFNRIYTKKRGERPDLGDPLVIKTDATIEAVVSWFLSSRYLVAENAPPKKVLTRNFGFLFLLITV